MSGQLLLEKVEAALQGGTQWIQYRDKSGEETKRLAEAIQLLELCKHYGSRFIINDDVELAKKIHAHGVHLGQDDTPVEEARAYLGENFIIGATCHNSMALATSAHRQGANYLAFGRFFPSQTKSDARQADLTILATAVTEFDLPIVAIGGINIENARIMFDHGAHATAVCRALFDCDDVKLRAQQFLNL